MGGGYVKGKGKIVSWPKHHDENIYRSCGHLTVALDGGPPHVHTH